MPDILSNSIMEIFNEDEKKSSDGIWINIILNYQSTIKYSLNEAN